MPCVGTGGAFAEMEARQRAAAEMAEKLQQARSAALAKIKAKARTAAATSTTQSSTAAHAASKVKGLKHQAAVAGIHRYTRHRWLQNIQGEIE